MERESLLALLIMLFGGVTLRCWAWWPVRSVFAPSARELERSTWFRLWRPVAAAATVAAWLCGWALSQPDPVPHHVGWMLLTVAVPFALIGARALARAAWSLCAAEDDHGVATVGLLRPRVVFAPDMARALDERAIAAALAHEEAHVRHRDPLRIWLAQFVTDLQWPSGAAQRRLSNWLVALEYARDDEARAAGTEGADLAAAVLGSLRLRLTRTAATARLIGQGDDLTVRISRLLRPLPAVAPVSRGSDWTLVAWLAVSLASATLTGLVCGDRLIAPLLALT